MKNKNQVQDTSNWENIPLLYNEFFNALLTGDRLKCRKIALGLLENKFPVKNLYEDILKQSLYEIGDLWENGEISVATEHLASAIVENILNDVYAQIVSEKHINKSVVVTCVENEFHQIGVKMVADIFEMNYWKVHFLGANIPVKDLIDFIEKKQPNLLAVSMSLYFHLPLLENILKRVNAEFPHLTILIGGQGMRHGGLDVLARYSNTIYVSDLTYLENFIRKGHANG